jgi:hypothetical protein
MAEATPEIPLGLGRPVSETDASRDAQLGFF